MSSSRLSVVCGAVCLIVSLTGCAAPGDDVSDEVATALTRAGANAAELQRALAEAPEEHRPGIEFLITHMPQRDLDTLSAEFLLNNAQLAYQAWRESPWADRVTEQMFLNDVLPYACVNERRDDWRERFYEQFKPLVADARTPGEAAVILNQQVFGKLNVKFSRQRNKADQSPIETIASGKASCTGLSILLVDACRSVGVPARLVGIPLWPDRSGNHSWVEVWDGEWKFTGAAEPSGDRLNRGWFAKKAGTARADQPIHAIYATSFRPTGTTFPLVWARDVDYVHAVNVTDRYARADAVAAPAGPMFDVEASLHAVAQLGEYLAQPAAEREPIGEQLFADVALTRADAAKATKLLCDDHAERVRQTRAAEMKARILTVGDKAMPFWYSVTGERPANGRSLYISMHGGGGAPKQVNDRQYENQKRLYKVPEGVYLVPRAPTNTWNLWHQKHIDPMFDRLIENLVVFEGVDPNRVYLMGYSAGGDGVYQLAPRMADRFAAASMMAGHPNESQPLGLRNLPFSIHVGGNDAAYNRNTVARTWGDKLAALHEADPGGYINWTKIYAGKGHWMDREDAAALPWMAKYTRNPLPRRIAWRQDDVTHTRFYWLAVKPIEAKKDVEVFAELADQRFDVRSAELKHLTIRVNDAMLDLDKPITVTSGDAELFKGKVTRTIGTLAKTLAERGDPKSVFAGEITVQLPTPAPATTPTE